MVFPGSAWDQKVPQQLQRVHTQLNKASHPPLDYINQPLF